MTRGVRDKPKPQKQSGTNPGQSRAELSEGVLRVTHGTRDKYRTLSRFPVMADIASVITDQRAGDVQLARCAGNIVGEGLPAGIGQGKSFGVSLQLQFSRHPGPKLVCPTTSSASTTANTATDADTDIRSQRWVYRCQPGPSRPDPISLGWHPWSRS